MSPEKDCHGTSRKKVVMMKDQRCNVKGIGFKNNNSRVALLACMSAAGEAVLPVLDSQG